MTIVNLHVPTGKGPAVELRGDAESMALGQDHAVLVVAATDRSGHLNVATQALVEHGFVAGGDASIRVCGGRPDDSQIYLKGNRLLLAGFCLLPPSDSDRLLPVVPTAARRSLLIMDAKQSFQIEYRRG